MGHFNTFFCPGLGGGMKGEFEKKKQSLKVQMRRGLLVGMLKL